MSRPIDADALRERLQNLAYDDWNQGIATSFADACNEVIEIVEEQPTIEPEVTEEEVKEYCRKRCLCIIDSALLKKYASAQPEPHYDEWCTDCKEYDQERHCCPRWNRVIRETLKDAQPEIVYCKDCKHRPKATRADEKIFYGFSVEFPDEKCPCYCEDGWYGWYPEDDFYCGYAERREE